MHSTNPYGFNAPEELNSFPQTELNWQNRFAGQIGNIFSNSLKESGKLSSYLGGNFEKHNLTGIGDTLGKVFKGDFKGGLNSAVDGLGIKNGITAGMSGFAKGMTGVGNVAGLANSALDVLGIGNIDRRTQSGGSKGLETFNKYSGVLMGTPLAPLAAIGAVAGVYDKVFAKSADKQGTADMNNLGYDTVINPLAGAKVGGWDRLRGKRGRINDKVKDTNRMNLRASMPGFEHKQNVMHAANTSQVLRDRNYTQAMGGYGTGMISAQLGTKLPAINKLIKPTTSPGDLSGIISRALANNKKKLSAPETFEEYKFRIAKLNPHLIADDPHYNLKGAYEAGMNPEMTDDGTYHLGSRNPKTGELLKSPQHSSWSDLVKVEEEIGNAIFMKDGKYYSQPQGQVSSIDREAAQLSIMQALSKNYKEGGLLNKADKEEVIEEVTEEKKNVIPEGAFHSRLNKYEEGTAEHVTRKGIPVITKDDDGKVTQHAEVERNEIIFHKEATDTMETLHEKYKKAETQKLKDEIMIECGKYVAEQILVNTDDRTGIIETI